MKSAILAFLAMVAGGCCGAVSVTASRDYVNSRTTLVPVTNDGVVVGFKLGIHTNDNDVLAAKSYVENSTPGDYETVSNLAMNARSKTDMNAYSTNGVPTGDMLATTGDVEVAMGRIRTDQITDGTNTIDAARNVYLQSQGWSINASANGIASSATSEEIVENAHIGMPIWGNGYEDYHYEILVTGWFVKQSQSSGAIVIDGLMEIGYEYLGTQGGELARSITENRDYDWTDDGDIVTLHITWEYEKVNLLGKLALTNDVHSTFSLARSKTDLDVYAPSPWTMTSYDGSEISPPVQFLWTTVHYDGGGSRNGWLSSVMVNGSWNLIYENLTSVEYLSKVGDVYHSESGDSISLSSDRMSITNIGGFYPCLITRTSLISATGDRLATTGTVASAIGNIRADRITDGTNTIDAAGNVYKGMYLNAWVNLGEDGTYGNVYTNVPGTLSWYSIYKDIIEPSEPRGYVVFNRGTWQYNNENTSPVEELGDEGTTSLGDGTFLRGNWPIIAGKLALTNDIPPAVAVVVPTTNAVNGAAADARATGTALWTGFTEWVCISGMPAGAHAGTPYFVEGGASHWVCDFYDSDDTPLATLTAAGDEDATTLVFSGSIVSPEEEFVTFTRHLVTPTKTSQLTNDGSNGVPYTALSDAQVNAIDSVVDERQAVVKYKDGTTSSFNIVGELGENSIQNKGNAVEVKIGSSVTSIGDYAFSYCSSLTSVTMPDSVTSIGVGAFYNCTNLPGVAIPDSVTSIGSRAFYGCSSLADVTIPNSVTSIGSRAFYNCTNLTSVTIPDSVTSIGSYAFSECSGLTNVIFKGKSLAEVSSMPNYPWGITDASIIIKTENIATKEWTDAQGFITSSDLPYALVTPGDWKFSGSSVQSGVAYTISIYEDSLNPGLWDYDIYADGVYLDSATGDTATPSSIEFQNNVDITATYTGIVLLDRAVSYVPVTGATTITLPDIVTSKSRDFYLKMVVTGSQQVSFSPSSGITYTGYGNPSNTYAGGTYLLHFTETASNVFNVVNALAATGSYNDLTDKPQIPVVSATDETFSNAVLSVGLNIDTNTVAAINALVEQGDDLPIGGAVSVGALLLALAAAVAALKRRMGTAETALAQKANATDLPYALVTPGEWEFSDGGTHTISVEEYDPADANPWTIVADGITPIYNSSWFQTKAEADAALEALTSCSFVGDGGSDITATRTSLPGHLLDRAVNKVPVSSETEITLPEKIAGGKSRDFYVRLSVSAESAVTFAATDSGGDAVAWDSMGNPSATLAVGTYLYRLTEVADGVFHAADITNGGSIDPAVLDEKLDASSAAPPFSESLTYLVDERVTYGGKLYRCKTAVNTAGAWTGTSNWEVDDMTSPDATLDIMSDGRLRVVTVAGEDLWMQGYDLQSTSAQVLKCEKVNLLKFSATTAEAFDSTVAYAVGDSVVYGGMVYKFTAAHSAGAWVGTDAAVDSVSLTMPYVPVGKVGDFVLDVDNSANASVKMTAELSGLFTAFDVFVDKGSNLSDLLTFDGGEQCELYFTMTAFGTQAKPAWKVVKQVVEKQEAGS